MTIAPATAADADVVIGLWHAAGLTRPWNDPAQDFVLALAQPNSTILTAQREGRMVGTVMAGHDGHRGWLYYLAVDPAARRGGLGRALVRAAEAFLVAQGCPKAMLMVRSDNAGVIAFYAALGFETQAVTTMGRRLD